jgi:hypothetical protein
MALLGGLSIIINICQYISFEYQSGGVIHSQLALLHRKIIPHQSSILHSVKKELKLQIT